MPREFASGIQHAEVATLPAASANPRVTLSQGGKLWFSDGTSWIDLASAAQLGTATPAALGTAAPGAASAASREDHVHPMPTAAQVGADPAGTGASQAAVAVNARIPAGTVTGRYARWNQTTSRWEEFDLLGSANIWTATQTFANTFASTLRLNAADGQEHILFGTPGAGTAGNPLLIIHKVDPTTLRITGWNGTALDGRLNIEMPLGVNINNGVFSCNTYAVFECISAAGTVLGSAGGAAGGLEAMSMGSGAGAGAAFMSFHRPGAYAVHFGLDTDNQLKVGGWSMGAVAHVIWHAGNSAQVQAGTATGQLSRWNNTTGRYEPVTLNTLPDAIDDAAAAGLGVAVGGLYRTGSTLKARIA